MTTDLPLVTCIMPTTPARDVFAKRAVELFVAQDYPRKEIVVVGDYDGMWWVGGSGPYYMSDGVSKFSIGEKRNIACDYAQGDLIAHWDDDDWHSPRRLSTQIEAMREQGARLCGLDRLVFYNGEHAWLFQTPRKPWFAGGTLVYERSLWQEQPFLEVSDGEDTAFVDAAVSRGIKVATLTDESLYVAMLHDANTTKRDVSRLGGSYDVDIVRRWIGG